MAQLNFTGKTMTLAAMKQRESDSIHFIKNPHTDKVFWVCGSMQGPVGQDVDKTKAHFSEFTTDEGEQVYILCNQAQSNEVDVW